MNRPSAPATAPRPPDTESAMRILRLFRIIFHAVATHLEQVGRRAGTPAAQLHALHAIGRQSGLGINALAHALDVRQPTASIFVKALARQNLVEIRREGRDRRAVQIHLLPAGRLLLQRTRAPLDGALAAVDAGTLLRMEELLAQLIGRLGACHHPAAAQARSGSST